tara:strand:- start:338 stop:556 length:219 start_codon:yes stop_codon:yes gene_type:complete
MIKKIDILTDNQNLFSFVNAYYNTNKQTQIKQGNKILFQGLINFELQRCGTQTQQQTYKNLKIKKFINKLKK